MSKDIKKYLKDLTKEGWTVLIGGKHYKLIAPNGYRISCSITPGCSYALKHIKGDVKRALKRTN